MPNPSNITPPLTKRIDLNVGYSCNIKCTFCYYINDVQARNRDKDLTTEECRKTITYLSRQGMEVLEFTGGEPTIRQDLFGLVRFARDAGFKKVSMITNGLRLADPGYAAEAVAAGVDDFLFSIHGSGASAHDSITGVNGSHGLLLKAIDNLLGRPVRVRCNSVVTGSNAADIYPRARLLSGLGIKTVNFIMFNPIEQAKFTRDENFIRYTDAAGQLKRAIDDFSGLFKKFTIRYMPFCVMKGCEGHIQNVHQVHYDHDEWDYFFRSYLREPRWKWLGGVAAGLAFLPGKKRWADRGLNQMRHAAILEAHSLLHKTRPRQCLKCRYGFICGGVWKEYARHFGTGELKADEGALILEPWHFMSEAQRAV